MLSIISLIAALTICAKVNCNPIPSNLETELTSKESKFINLNLYESQIAPGLSGQLLSDFDEDKLSDDDWEAEFLATGRKNCQIGSKTRHICERCAKITKSEKAYAYCCIDKHDIRDWCSRYIAFSYSK